MSVCNPLSGPALTALRSPRPALRFTVIKRCQRRRGRLPPAAATGRRRPGAAGVVPAGRVADPTCRDGRGVSNTGHAFGPQAGPLLTQPRPHR